MPVYQCVQMDMYQFIHYILLHSMKDNKMKITLTVLIAANILLTGLLAQPASDEEVLNAMLTEFLEGASRNDIEVHDRFWADDLIYTASTGRRVGKAEIMNNLRSTHEPEPDDPGTTYSAEDIRIQLYDNMAIVAFRLVAKTVSAEDTTVAHYLNTGTFLKRDGRWQVISWQATAVS
jgi:hypothetical protein